MLRNRGKWGRRIPVPPRLCKDLSRLSDERRLTFTAMSDLVCDPSGRHPDSGFIRKIARGEAPIAGAILQKGLEQVVSQHLGVNPEDSSETIVYGRFPRANSRSSDSSPSKENTDYGDPDKELAEIDACIDMIMELSKFDRQVVMATVKSMSRRLNDAR